jgi:hypothetical protein
MLALDPDNVAALETLGIQLYRTGDRPRAVALFRRAVATGTPSGISLVGLANDARGDDRVHWLELAWRAEPRDRWILDELARASPTPADVARRRAAIERLHPGVDRSPSSAWLPR